MTTQVEINLDDTPDEQHEAMREGVEGLLAQLPPEDGDDGHEGVKSGMLYPVPAHYDEMGKELVTVMLPLTEDERLELAGRMADALASRDKLEAEFNAVKKDYKARIEIAISDAAEAGAEYRAGERTHSILCNKYEDNATLEIVHLCPSTGREMARRPMQGKELQHTLSTDEGTEGTTEPTPDNHGRTCLSCAHNSVDVPQEKDPCMQCHHADNGHDDNWYPLEECKTCAYSTNSVDSPPCAGCSLNPDADYQGEESRWLIRVVILPAEPVQ